MFESSFVASQVGSVSDRKGIWAFAISMQTLAVLALGVGSLLHPGHMSVGAPTVRLALPRVLREPKPIEVKRVTVAEASTHAVTLPSRMETALPKIGRMPSMGEPAPVAVEPIGMGMGRGALPAVLSSGGGAPTVRVGTGGGAVRSGPLRVSSGVGAGMLMTPIRPVYPAIARAARVSGEVVVEAVISREGRIERARVVTGPAMLAGAALEAIRAARYAPYRLNGEPTEVETRITVEFVLGG